MLLKYDKVAVSTKEIGFIHTKIVLLQCRDEQRHYTSLKINLNFSVVYQFQSDTMFDFGRE